MKALETVGLTKVYRDVVAVDSLDLEVGEGEIYGFLGRNGAGFNRSAARTRCGPGCCDRPSLAIRGLVARH